MTANYLTILAEASQKQSPGLADPRIILGLLVIVVCFFLYARARKRIQRNQKNFQWSAPDKTSFSTEGTTIYNQITELMAELCELSRQINGQIDTRVAKLELLIKEADQKLAQLEQSTGKTITPAEPFQNPRPPVSNLEPMELGPTGNNSPPPVNSSEFEVIQLSQKGLSSISIAQRLNRPLGEIELILSLNSKKQK